MFTLTLALFYGLDYSQSVVFLLKITILEIPFIKQRIFALQGICGSLNFLSYNNRHVFSYTHVFDNKKFLPMKIFCLDYNSKELIQMKIS